VAVETKVGGNSSDITGYHAKRNEFDPDYDAEAELPLAEMDFAKGEQESNPEEYALKCRMLMIYNERLNERARRKQFILERGLLNVKKMQAADRKRTKEEREIHARFAVFARFHSQVRVHLQLGLLLPSLLPHLSHLLCPCLNNEGRPCWR
jgi:transcriptional adapter 2-alpha